MIPLDGSVEDVAVENGYAFVVNGDNGLQVFDVSNPSSAYIVANVPTPKKIMDISLDNHIAYLTAQSALNIYVIDVSDPPNAEFTGYIDADYLNVGCPTDIIVLNGFAGIGASDGFLLMDVDPYDSAYLISGLYQSDIKVRDMALIDGYALLLRWAGNQYRIYYIDIYPPEQMHVSGWLDAEFLNDMSLYESTLATVGGGGLLLYDLN
jgi:hypothetical protein